MNALRDDIAPRQREIMVSAIRHLHAFCQDVDLSYDEWTQAMGWLRRAGDISDDARNEFILIIDILGVEVLVDMLDKKPTMARP